MPTPTYVAIAKTVLTGSQATITFSSIPSTYTDLSLCISARSDIAGTPNADIRLQINAISSGYSDTALYAQTTTPASFRETAVTSFAISSMVNGVTSTSNTFSSVDLYFPNYAGNFNKPISITGVQENNSASNGLWTIIAYANLLSNNAVINTLTLTAPGGSFVSGSRFDLYGIKNS